MKKKFAINDIYSTLEKTSAVINNQNVNVIVLYKPVKNINVAFHSYYFLIHKLFLMKLQTKELYQLYLKNF